MWKFLGGTLFGLVLSVAYVWYGIALPDWMELPGLFQRSVTAAAIDDVVIDLDTPEATRRRALEVYFANQAKRAAELEAELGFPLTRAMQFRRVKREAQILRAQWSALDVALGKPALLQALQAKHQTTDSDTLKRRMLMAALAEKVLLKKWLERHSRQATEQNVIEVITNISRLAEPPSR